MDEGLDDCLVGACGSQGIHCGEVWSHESGPEADGQVFTGHQVHPAQLAHPGKTQSDISLFILIIQCKKKTNKKTDGDLSQKTNKAMKVIKTEDRELTCVSGSLHI